MANEEIKNRILMEMNDELTDIQLQKLKMCLERNFYGVTIVDNCTDIVTTETVSNEQMIAKFVFEQKISGLSNFSLSTITGTLLTYLEKKPTPGFANISKS